MRYSGRTDIGRVRDHNEDAWRFAKLDAQYDFFIISDGVGGHAAGEVASQIVVETLPALLEARVSSNMNIEALKTALKECLVALNDSVLQHARGVWGVHGMAATVVSALIADNVLVLGHLGDSRCYLLREKRLHQLTKDHTVVQMLLDLGEITAEQVHGHPASGRITQVVGMEQTPNPDVQSLDLQQDDRLLLCSDGLHGMINDAAIATLISSAHIPETVCRELVQAALDAGGRDNITVIIVDIEKPEVKV